MTSARLGAFAALFLTLLLAACGGGVAMRDPLPTDFPVQGIDVSRYQGDIDWNAVRRSGISFAFIKATEGGDWLDPMFHHNFDAARIAGVPRAPYHFFYFCRPAEEQVAWFARNVPNDPDALPPVLDVEWDGNPGTCRYRPSPAEARRQIRIWLVDIERLYHKRPIIYTSVDFHRDVLAGHFEEFPIWVRSVTCYPIHRYHHRRWTFWQYTAKGHVAGVRGHVDRNVFAGTPRDFERWATGRVEHNRVWRF